ncbi:MAG: polymer-forming cytoskeletal protein [Niveispirillum sp.]|nr:polymer-forming cytoskeletal protein [Niveispirillum sp.]
MFARILIQATLLLTLCGPAWAGAELQTGAEIRLIAPVADDLVAAGRSISVDAPVTGDVVAAGLDLRVTAPVSGDALLAGFDLAVKGPVQGDLAAIAFDLSVTSDVAGDALLNAAELTIGPTAHIAGDLIANGTEVTLSGRVDGDAHLTGDRVIVTGRVAGDLEVTSGMLELRPGAAIEGDLRHNGPMAVEVPAGVEVGGTVRHHYQSAPDEGPTILGSLGKALALFLLGVGLLWLLPGPVLRAADAMPRNPLRHLLLGAAILLLSPLLLGLLMVSVIGIPLGVLMLGLWLLALPVGIVITGFALAVKIGRRRMGMEREAAAALLRRYAVAAMVMAALPLVPVAGLCALTLIAAIGVGALAENLRHGRRGGLAVG